MNPASILSLISILLPIAVTETGNIVAAIEGLKKAHGDANKIQAALLLLMPAVQAITKLPQTHGGGPVTVNLAAPGTYNITINAVPTAQA